MHLSMTSSRCRGHSEFSIGEGTRFSSAEIETHILGSIGLYVYLMYMILIHLQLVGIRTSQIASHVKVSWLQRKKAAGNPATTESRNNSEDRERKKRAYNHSS